MQILHAYIWIFGCGVCANFEIFKVWSAEFSFFDRNNYNFSYPESEHMLCPISIFVVSPQPEVHSCYINVNQNNTDNPTADMYQDFLKF